MDLTRDFRRRLAARLFLVALAGAGAATACSGNVSTPKGEGGGGAGGSGGTGASTNVGGLDDGSFTGEECFAWPVVDGGMGTGGVGGAGGSGGAGGAGGAGGSGGAGGGAMVPPCPASTEAMMYMNVIGCGGDVLSPGTFAAGQCCYQVYHYGCGVGRPYVADGKPRAAKAAPKRNGWADADSPSVEGLSASDREKLAEAWARDALLEHASVASFGRFAMELLAVGAPPSLIALAHEAALDEIEHARLAFSLASAYAGTALAPGSFPFDGAVPVSNDLADIAARAVSEGCIAETLASLVAAEQGARAEDPAVRHALEKIAEDEARHAELAWKTVAWAVQTGGAAVARAVAGAFERAFATKNVLDAPAGSAALQAHGRPAAEVLLAVMRQGLEDVVKPAAAALLGEPLRPAAAAD